ncbi:ATPase, T2SS/T4P/T4SS family [Thermoflexus sp.]|uniref:ATPase, T2SS/T4P/T4SS family n=1 Tax=Thermoflexus sp. TaxID=1969742 RepID=UPI0035E4018C
MGMTPESWRWVRDRVSQLLASARISLPPEALERLVDEVGDEVVGYGPIGLLVRDPSITEIMVNGPHQVYVERAGKIVEVDVRFRDESHGMEVIERILRPVGRKVDRAWPMADARLPDGSRRKITRVTEIQGMEGDTVVLQDPFVFQAKAIGEAYG